MKCPKYQTGNPEGAKLCKKCGQSLQTELMCPHCGQTNSADSEFLIECGRCRTGEVTATTHKQPPEPNNKATSFHTAFFTALLFRLLDAQRLILPSC